MGRWAKPKKVKKYSDNIEFEQITLMDILSEPKTKKKDTDEAQDKIQEITNDDTKDNISYLKSNTSENINIHTVIKPIDLNINASNSNNEFIKTQSKKFLEVEKRNEQETKYKRHPYIAKDRIVTPAESQLFHYIENFFRENIRVFPKVRLADIIDIDTRMKYSKYDFYKICNKHVDFAICDGNTLDLICIVELDDFTHDSDNRQERDTFVNQVLYDCKIPIIRIKTNIDKISGRDMERIDFFIKSHFAPKCPICGGPTEVRSSKSYTNMGHRFWGCKNFPVCRGTIDID